MWIEAWGRGQLGGQALWVCVCVCDQLLFVSMILGK